MSAPKWKWEWNLNTLLVIVGFIGMFVTWGYTLATFSSNQQRNTDAITDISSRVSANETALRRIDNHELRITNIEKAASDAAASMKSLDATINGLSSDMRVVREILQRIEAAQKARYQP
jgi:hypothetical protein